MAIELPNPLAYNGRLQLVSRRFWAGQASPEDLALRRQALVSLSAFYNETMRLERAQRKQYNCPPNWQCQCPAHQRASYNCSEIHERIRHLDAEATDGTKPLSAAWWSNRGFTLVVPGDDPVFDYVLLDGEIPIPPGIPARAARWWVNFMVADLPGHAIAGDMNDVFYAYRPTVCEPIDWSADLKQKLQAALETAIASRFPCGKGVQKLEPINIAAGRWGHDSMFTDICLPLGLGMPQFRSNVEMSITAAAISINQTGWTAMFVD